MLHLFLLSSRHAAGKGRLGGEWEPENPPVVLGWKGRGFRVPVFGLAPPSPPLPGLFPRALSLPTQGRWKLLSHVSPLSGSQVHLCPERCQQGKNHSGAPHRLSAVWPAPAGTSHRTLTFGGNKKRGHCKDGLLIF